MKISFNKELLYHELNDLLDAINVHDNDSARQITEKLINQIKND